MLAWSGALILVAGFLVLVRVLRLPTAARRVLVVAENVFAIIGDDSIEEEARETALWEHKRESIKLLIWIVGGGIAALALPLVMVWWVGWTSIGAVVDVVMSWPFLLALVAGFCGWRWRTKQRRLSARTATRSEDHRSIANRLLHQISFSTPGPQLATAYFEDRVFGRRLARIKVSRPVFIAGLPEAGSALLLELGVTGGEFVTHRHRQMPFVLMPLLWEKLSRHFRTDAPGQPRPQGDGIQVGLDSPESMEEALWLAYWPEYYADDRIHLWRATSACPGFADFFRQHIRKLIAAAGADRAKTNPRYISRNHLNIARIPWLKATFRDARVLIPFRSPVQQAASLRRRHQHFIALHKRDPFARRYMAATGHFHAGANLRPVNFDNWLHALPDKPTDLSYWLRYWTAAYRHLLTIAGPDVQLFDFDAFCQFPKDSFPVLAEFLEVANPFRLVAGHERVHEPQNHTVDASGVAADVLGEAVSLHGRLSARALVPSESTTTSGIRA